MNSQRWLLASALSVLSLAAIACASDANSAPANATVTATASIAAPDVTSTETPTAIAPPSATVPPVQPTSAPAAHLPDGARTGHEGVDRVLDAVMEMDIVVLASLVAMRAEPCVTVPGQSEAPPWLCPEGVAEGTLVERFDTSACGGDYGLGSEVERYVEALFDPAHHGYLPDAQHAKPLHLYAIVRDDGREYTAFFVYGRDSVTRSLGIDDDGRIVRIGYGCGDPAAVAVPRDGGFLLAPPGYVPPRHSVFDAPRPDESAALPVDEARALLSQIDGLGQVIEAAETLDIAGLLSLAEPGTIDCAAAGRSSPAECETDPTAVLTTVTHAIGVDVPRHTSRMERMLDDHLGDYPLALAFVSRDATRPEGVGGRYFVVFKSPGTAESERRYDSLAVVVWPGREHPIESFSFIQPDYNGLHWIQWVAFEPQLLLTPESVASWPGYDSVDRSR